MPAAVVRDHDRDVARRREILDAALACFLRFGYGKTSLDDIARQAKLSRPLLYRKFANKEAIFAALYDDVFQTCFHAADAIVRGPGTRASKLERLCEVVWIEPYALIMTAPMADEFWAACDAILPDMLARHRRTWRALLARVLHKPLVDVFDLSLEGLFADKSSVAVFRRRVRVLVSRFL